MLFDKNLMAQMLPGGSRIPRGIETNVSVTSMEIDPKWVDFNYANADGQTLRKRIFFPNADETKAYTGMTPQETYERQVTDAALHIAKHASIFLPKEVLERIESNDLKDYALKIRQVLTPELSKKKVNLKVVADSTGNYSAIPKYFSAASPYIEEYVVGQPPALFMTKKEIDAMKPEVNDSSPIADDDLPF